MTAPRREDYGIAQLEALADGCVLVTTAAPGPYAALPLARRSIRGSSGDDLAGALRTALDDPAPGTRSGRAGCSRRSADGVDGVARPPAAELLRGGH